jgi:hypothetical protein
MIDVLVLITFVVILYAMRRVIQSRIQGILLLLGGTRKTGIWFYSLLFFPGVVMHELSHFFTAAILGVRTGDINLFPRLGDVDEGRIALGSVKIARTDFVRGSLIGAAPFLVGSLVLYVVMRIFFSEIMAFLVSGEYGLAFHLMATLSENWEFWIGMGGIFLVGNTMFSSREDTRAFPVLGVILGIISLVIWLSGNSHYIVGIIPILVELARALNVAYGLAIVLNLLVAGILFGLERVAEKLTRKRVVYR